MHDLLDKLKNSMIHERLYVRVVLVIAFIETVLLLLVAERMRSLAHGLRGMAEQMSPKEEPEESKKQPGGNDLVKPESAQEDRMTPANISRWRIFDKIPSIVRWGWDHLLLTVFVTIALITGIWLVVNRNTWIVLPFVVGPTESITLDGEKVAIQLIAELSQIGAGNPPPAITFWEPQEPHTNSGSVLALANLPLEECDTILQGPGDFIATWAIAFPMVTSSSEDALLDLGDITIGTLRVPSRLFLQFLLRIIPNSYREFSGQIHEDNGELEISVTLRKPLHSWRVVGPADAFPVMMEYLAVRMILDLKPELIEKSGLKRVPSDQDLAFALGIAEFRAQRYQRAQAFFEITERFAPLDNKVDAMLSLAHYQQALVLPLGQTTHLNSALRAMTAAVREDPFGASSSLRPYLICLLEKSGQKELSDSHRAIFDDYLKEREYKNYDVRVAYLKALPQHGPGWRLWADDHNIRFLDTAGNIRNAFSEIVSPGLPTLSAARQIRFFKDIAFIVREDGAVETYTPSAGSLERATFVFGNTLDGVQQIGISYSERFQRTNLILLNRFGKLYWCKLEVCLPDINTRPRLEKPIFSEQQLNAVQFFLIDDHLYILTTNGNVWYSELGVGGQVGLPQQLTSTNDVQEIFATDDDILFLLHNYGSVSRLDKSRSGPESVSLIDNSTTTAHIYIAEDYLYLLKKDGNVWRVSNSHNPDPDNDFVKIAVPPEGMVFNELYVTEMGSQEDGISGSLIVFLLNDQRNLCWVNGTGVVQMNNNLISCDPPPKN